MSTTRLHDFCFRIPTLLLAVLLTGAGLLTGCDQSGMDGPNPTTYTASLTALNNSGVSGEATVTVEGNRLTVNVSAQGTEKPVHAQHIHGFASDASSCPTAAADTSGDGRISVGEGAPSYGRILMPLDGSLDNAEGLGDLETFPTAAAVAATRTNRQSQLAIWPSTWTDRSKTRGSEITPLWCTARRSTANTRLHSRSPAVRSRGRCVAVVSGMGGTPGSALGWSCPPWAGPGEGADWFVTKHFGGTCV